MAFYKNQISTTMVASILESCFPDCNKIFLVLLIKHMRNMKKASLILGFLCVYGLLTGQSISIDRQVTMLAMGDSYTIGESVDTLERWPHQFIDELKKLGVSADYPDYIAATGWTTPRLIQGLKFQLDHDKDYNLVSILIGVNNQYQGIDIESYEPDLRTLIDQAMEIVNQDASRVFMLSIPDYAFTPFGGENEEISQEIDDYNSIKRNIASEYGIAYIDITPISRNGLNNPSLVAGDGLHPSGLQYEQWVQTIVPRLTLDLN
jgi:acyl-CoA thioesterase-1